NADVAADAAFLDHAELGHYLGRYGVVGAAGSPKAVKSELFEAQSQEKAYRFGAETLAPPVGAEREPQLAAGLAGVLRVDCKSGEPDHLARLRRLRGQRVFGAVVLLCCCDHAFERGGDLVSVSGFEAEVFRHHGIAVNREDRVDVVVRELPQGHAGACDRDRVHGLEVSGPGAVLPLRTFGSMPRSPFVRNASAWLAAGAVCSGSGGRASRSR